MKYARVGMVFFYICVFLLSSNAMAHTEEQSNDFSPVTSIFATTMLILFIIVIYTAVGNRFGEGMKKTMFIIIAASIAFTTVYLVADTAIKILESESGGVVHWHADFTIDICGERMILQGPQHFLDNKVGTPLLHHHDEGASLNGQYRIHIEGIVAKLQEVDLGHFFEVIGGQLTSDSLSIILKDDNVKTVRNGDLCQNGIPGMLKVLVNGQLMQDPGHYIISPYSNVPPGDFIEIIFD